MKELEIDNLLRLIKSCFDEIKDVRGSNMQYKLGDILQSGLAIFSLKDSSLLEFTERFDNRSKNLKRIYKIESCPSDNQMRLVLDKVKPIEIERVRLKVSRLAEQSGLMDSYEYFKGWKLLLTDGVHHYSSKTVSCVNCLERNHSDDSTSYSHSMLATVIAHPEMKEVFPLEQEPIIQQDGETKNDCELNASKRLIEKIQTRHSKDRFIFVKDALYGNGPHIRSITEKGNRYIIRCKEGSGAGSVISTYEKILEGSYASSVGRYRKLLISNGIPPPSNNNFHLGEVRRKKKGVEETWSFANGLPLNKEHPDISTNFLRHSIRDIEKGTEKVFEWITNIHLDETTIAKVGCAGRARWKIENEAFNTLKNQGYHFDHNFGHGKQNLCTNFSLLMMLAFLIDQIQQASNKLFNAALKKVRRKKRLWEDIRSFFNILPFKSMAGIYKSITHGISDHAMNFDPDSG